MSRQTLFLFFVSQSNHPRGDDNWKVFVNLSQCNQYSFFGFRLFGDPRIVFRIDNYLGIPDLVDFVWFQSVRLFEYCLAFRDIVFGRRYFAVGSCSL